MELILLQIAAFIRPLASMEYAEPLFAALGVGLFGLLLGGLLIRAAVQQTLRFSTVDTFVVAFSIWALTGTAIYYQDARVGELLKLVLPILSYTVVKNIVPDREAYRRLVVWILVGFSIPAILSVALIALNHPSAVDMVNYWTDVTRWKGVYTHSHNLGHSMTLFLMTIVLYLSLRERAGSPGSWARRATNGALLAAAAVAAFGLYMSQVRSAVLGLMVFFALYTFLTHKRVFLLAAGATTVIAVATLPYWFAAMFPELDLRRRGVEVDTLDLGSGRPRFWLNDLSIYGQLPLDQKLAGVGAGVTYVESAQGELLGHNDWLGLLTQTGLIGLLLFVGLQIAVLRTIFRMPAPARHVFLALFAAVNVMMAVSNSYVWRIQVAHLYYILLAFIEVPVAATRPAVKEFRRERLDTA